MRPLEDGLDGGSHALFTHRPSSQADWLTGPPNEGYGAFSGDSICNKTCQNGEMIEIKNQVVGSISTICNSDMNEIKKTLIKESM